MGLFLVCRGRMSLDSAASRPVIQSRRLTANSVVRASHTATPEEVGGNVAMRVSCQWHLIHSADATGQDDELPGRGPPGLMGMASARRLHVLQVADTTRQQSFHEA